MVLMKVTYEPSNVLTWMTLNDEFACRNGALRAGKKTSGVYKIQSGLIYSFVIWKLFPRNAKLWRVVMSPEDSPERCVLTITHLKDTPKGSPKPPFRARLAQEGVCRNQPGSPYSTFCGSGCGLQTASSKRRLIFDGIQMREGATCVGS